jgi:hypothetical protein
MPFVLRDVVNPYPSRENSIETSKPQRYRLSSECFVHGVMYGEAAQMNLKRKKIEIE